MTAESSKAIYCEGAKVTGVMQTPSGAVHRTVVEVLRNRQQHALKQSDGRVSTAVLPTWLTVT
jgi:hypothetical protein